MEENKKQTDEVTIGELIWTLATKEEREFAMDPVAYVKSNLDLQQHLSIKVAYIYDNHADSMIYLQLLQRDLKKHPNQPYRFILARLKKAIRALTMDKPYIAGCILAVIAGILSFIFTPLVGLIVGCVLFCAFCLLCLAVESNMQQQYGFSGLIPDKQAVDDEITKCEKILAAARRELRILEDDGGIPEEAWPYAEKIWNDLACGKAHTLKEEMINLGIEYAEDE